MPTAITNLFAQPMEWVNVAAWETPVPQSLTSIHASGYDAIAQFGHASMIEAVRRSLGNQSINLSFGELSLSKALRDEVDRRVAEAELLYYWAPGTGIGDIGTYVRAEYDAQSLLLRALTSGVSVTVGEHPNAIITLALNLEVRVVETLESYARRTGRPVPPLIQRDIGQMPGRHTSAVRLESVEMTLEGPIVLEENEAAFSVAARVDLGSARPQLVGGSVWSGLIAENTPALLSRFRRVDVAPALHLLGDPAVQAPTPIPAFKATAIGVAFATQGRALALCLELGRVSAAPDWSRVRAFTGDHGYAMFTTLRLVDSVLRARWDDISARTTEVDVPFSVQRPEGGFDGSVRLRIALGECYGASMGYGSDQTPDHFNLAVELITEGIRATAQGEDVSDQVDDLRQARAQCYALNVFAGHAPASFASSQLHRWADVIGRQLLPTVLLPLARGWHLKGDYFASVSAPLGAMIVRGELL